MVHSSEGTCEYITRWVVILLLFSFTFGVASGQSDTTAVPKNVKFLTFPFAFYTPETNMGFGGLGLTTFRFRNEPITTHRSQVGIGVAYTLFRQFLLYVPYQFFWKKEQYKLYGELGYFTYFYYFNGIGPDPSAKRRESFDVNFPRVQVNFLDRIVHPVYLGIRYAFDNFNFTRFDPAGALQERTILGTAGGVVSGLGPVANFDTRDAIFIPYRGILADASFMVNNSVFGSDYNFVQTNIEISGYIPLKQLAGRSTTGRLNQPVLGLNLTMYGAHGDVPFYAMGLIGGPKRMRGYYEGYFRDRKMIEGQAEFRMPLFNKWKGNWKRFGAVAFGGLGTVSPTWKAFAVNNIVYTYGAGLRVLLDRAQGINLRVDYAWSATTSGFYLSIGEAF